MVLNEIITLLEKKAPLKLQETYDNSGLLIGSPNKETEKALISLDVTEEVINEAITNKCNLIISHHPVIFKGLKKLTGSNTIERIVEKAIKNDIALYAIHTNLDNVSGGVNSVLAKRLGVTNCKILQPGIEKMYKIVTFCPHDSTQKVMESLFSSGAGNIGNYDSCSYLTEGKGTFRALEGSDPYIGELNKLHYESETKIECIIAEHKLSNAVKAMLKSHPYEEVAYDIIPLQINNPDVGAGMIGELPMPVSINEFLKTIKDALGCQHLKHNKLINHPVRKVAFCGGSGSFLINTAAKNNADIFITGDIKYHDYFEHTGRMTLVDAGHFETEHPVKELLYAFLKENFPNFALQISKSDVNPVSFL